MNEPSTSSFNGATNHPAIASLSEDPPFLNKQILELKSQVNEMKLENEKLNQTIKNQKDLICSQAMTIMELQNNLGNRGDNLLVNKSMEDKLATMKAVETDLKLKNAELELKVEAEKKMHIELTLVKDNQIVQLQRENEANVKKIKDLEQNLTHIIKLKEEETNAIIAAQRKVIQDLKNEHVPSSEASSSNQRNSPTLNTPSISNNNDRQPKTPLLESRGLRSRRNMNGEKSKRRSSRSHHPVNYADDDDSDNGYLKSKPGPSRKLQSNSGSITSRSTSKTPSKQIHSDTVASSPSGDDGSDEDEEEEDSDFAVDEQEDDKSEYEEEKVEVKPLVSSEFEDTDVGARNSSATRKNTTRRKRFGSHDTTSSTASSVRNIQASNRKRKAETPPTEPKKLRPRLALRSETNRHYNEDGDYQDNESDQEPQNVRRSRRAKPIVNYEETKIHSIMDDQQTLPPHFQNELDSLENEFDSTKNEIDELKKLNDDQKDMIYDQAMTIRGFQKESAANKNIEEKLTKMKAVETELKLKNVELEQKSKDLEIENEAKNVRIKALESIVSATNGPSQSSNNGKQVLQDEIKKLQSICDKSEKKIKDLEAKMVQTENENANQSKIYQTEIEKLKVIVEARNKKITELNATIKNHEKVEYNFRSKITELEENYKATLERKMELKNREIKDVKEKMKKMADEIKKCKSESVSGIQEQSGAVPILPTPAKRGRPRKIKIAKKGGRPPKAILPPTPSSNENVTPTATVSVKRGRPKKVIPLQSIENKEDKENEPSEKSPAKRGRPRKHVTFFSP